MSSPDDHLLVKQYSNKPENYYKGARRDFVALLPGAPHAAILELGCGNGATGALAIKFGKCREYVGIELMPTAANDAELVLNRVICGDVERLELDLPEAHFDALITSEVLEHLVDPWAVLRKLGRYLKPGAITLASSPNVANWKIIRNLINGKFNLENQGIMDRTHLRWFTPATYADLFQSSVYRVEKVWPISELSLGKNILSVASGGRRHLFYKQICISARWLG